MEKVIPTVTGNISSDELGCMLTHEHFVSLDWSMRIAFPQLFEEEIFIKRAEYLINKAKASGLRSIIDLTCINNGRDLKLMQSICERTGLQTVFCTGLYFNEEPWVPGRLSTFIADLFIKELTDGVEDTGIKPGVIKCATDKYGFSEINKVILKASAIAARETSVPVFTHTVAKMKHGIQQQEILEREGVDLRRVVIGHLGDTNDLEYLQNIMKQGSFVGLDRFGSVGELTNEDRINNILELIDMGYISQLLISHDYPLFYDWGENNWEKEKRIPVEKVKVGFSYIMEKVIPELIKRGLSHKEIHVLMVENPKRLFEI